MDGTLRLVLHLQKNCCKNPDLPGPWKQPVWRVFLINFLFLLKYIVFEQHFVHLLLFFGVWKMFLYTNTGLTPSWTIFKFLRSYFHPLHVVQTYLTAYFG